MSAKLDLLFVVGNSPGMAEKQALFAESVPELLNELVRPRCVDERGSFTGERADIAAPEGQMCSRGTPAHPPVIDMHIGVLSSSLGGYGTDACPIEAADPRSPLLNAHNDDGGRLVNRSGREQRINPRATPLGFLSWFPPVKQNELTKPSEGSTPTGDLGLLVSDTVGLVEGIGSAGCPFSSPLEAAYRFLVSPAPPRTSGWSSAPHAPAEPELDAEIVAQRARFLRPDSTVAVVFVTDRDDVSLDPWSVGGQGKLFLESVFPMSASVPGAQRDPARGGSTAPKGTSSCAANPASPACTSCGFRGDLRVVSDPNCQWNDGFHAMDDDDLAVRFHAMKQRFGVEPQYPIKRYVDGFSTATVPLLSERSSKGDDVGGAHCRNPLFSRDLPLEADGIGDPALCGLARGPREPTDVIVAVLGGVPADLVPAPLSVEEDWVAIDGADPSAYDLTGLDARMATSTQPRPGRPQGPLSGDDRDFDTKKLELQYACTFPLPAPEVCTGRDEACPCDGETDIPICLGATKVRGKATPSTRPLRLARHLRGQALVGSICPETTDPAARERSNVGYGYRSIMHALVDRIGPRMVRTEAPGRP